MEKKYNTTECLSNSFTQRKKISQLEGDLRFTGRIYFKKSNFIKMELQGDENLNIYCNGEKIWVEDTDLGEVETYDFHKLRSSRRLSRLLPPVFLHSVQSLKEYFEISLIETEGRRDRLELIPKPGSNFSFTYLRFDVDSWGRIPWMKVEYENGDSTEMEFRKWARHPEISDYFFQYRKPLKNSHPI
ncbi:outer membrane lipoprotein carrier protein LolA [Acidobacteriota bacterium]